MISVKKKKILIITILIVCIALILFLPSRTPQIEGTGSIASIQKVKLGGLEQTILIRGKDTSNPVLLFLHGGPGYSQISFARKYQEELEDSFIVVNWDQRGSGMSYSGKIDKDSMNRSQFVKDTKELIDYLCTRFNKQKVYLVGHSFGTELGMYVINEYPEKIAAFISIGQVVNGTESEIISYNYALETAKKSNDKKALEDLNRIGTPPYKDPVNDTLVQRKWLAKYRGVERRVNTQRDIVLGSIFSSEYTGIDGIRMAIGSKFSADTMWGQNSDLDFIRDIPEVKVPIYFCAGRYDYNTPSELIEKYYNHIKAPEKELIWFEQSAHFPHFEECEKFINLAISIKNRNE